MSFVLFGMGCPNPYTHDKPFIVILDSRKLTFLAASRYGSTVKKAVSYLRVSSEDQVGNTSLDDQQRINAEFIEQNGWEQIAVFREEGESAKTAKRPQLIAMLAYCRENRVDFAVALDVKRFARNVYDHMDIKRTLAQSGTLTRFVLDRFDDSPSGRFHEVIMSGAAAFDNEERSERSKRGMSATVRAGGWVAHAPKGYKCARVGRLPSLVPDEAVAMKVRDAFNAVASGVPLAEAVRPLRISRAWEFIQRPVFAGYNRVDGELVAGSWPAIVPFDVWALAQERIRRKNRAVRLDFWMRGFLRCECGQMLTASYSKGRTKKYGYYHCKACHARHPSQKLEAEFLAWLEKESAKHAESFKAVKLAAAKEIRAIADEGAERQRLAHAESERAAKKLSALVDMKLNGDISQEEYCAKRNELITERDEAQRAYLLGAISDEDVMDMLDDAAWILDHFAEFLGNAQHPELLLILRSLVGSTITRHGCGTWSNRENDGLYWLESSLGGAKQTLAPPTGFEPVLPG